MSPPPAAGSIEENIYSRQLYKQQMSAIGYDGKHEKRMFSGIIDSGEKGERASPLHLAWQRASRPAS